VDATASSAATQREYARGGGALVVLVPIAVAVAF
jgi:hypothetical protein